MRNAWLRGALFLFALILLLSAVGCEEKRTVGERQLGDDRIPVWELVSRPLVSIEEEQARRMAVNRSDFLVRCRVIGCEGVRCDDSGNFRFTYDVGVTEVLMGQGDAPAPGDRIDVLSTEGVLSAAEAVERHRSSDVRDRIAAAAASYGDRAFVICSESDAIPIEVGRTYLMFLSSDAPKGQYAEVGASCLYEIDGQTVRQGRRRLTCECSADELIGDLRALAAEKAADA